MTSSSTSKHVAEVVFCALWTGVVGAVHEAKSLRNVASEKTGMGLRQRLSLQAHCRTVNPDRTSLCLVIEQGGKSQSQDET